MKAFLFIFVFHILLIFPGCGAFSTRPGAPKGEPGKTEAGIGDLKKRNMELEQELQRIKDESELELAGTKDENRRLLEKIKELQEENQRNARGSGALERQGRAEEGQNPRLLRPTQKKRPSAWFHLWGVRLSNP
jgi:hypothetical protein